MTTTANVWEWLESVRGLDAGLCERMGLRAANHPQLGPGVALPYIRGGERYAEKMRPFGEKTFRWHPKGAEHGLFNADVLADETLFGQPVIITEGEFDAISVIQAGFPRAVSVPDGWSASADGADNAKLKPLVAAEMLLRQSPCVIVAADADETGEAFTRAIAALLESHPVRVVTWPEGCKDANDVLRQHDAGVLAKALHMARLIDPPGGSITGFSDMPPVSSRRILRLGFDPFDRGLAFEEGAMSVCTGVPGFGKSTFVRFCAHHLTRNEGIRIGAMEFENSVLAMRNHLARLNTGRAFEDLNQTERKGLCESLDRHWRIAHRAPDGGVEENIEWLRKRIQTLAVRDRCKFIYVDPWNELEHMPEPGENMTTYINWATKSIRQWAERYDTHVCIIAHPKKMPAGSGIPDGYDVADSAAWANKPIVARGNWVVTRHSHGTYIGWTQNFLAELNYFAGWPLRPDETEWDWGNGAGIPSIKYQGQVHGIVRDNALSRAMLYEVNTNAATIAGTVALSNNPVAANGTGRPPGRPNPPVAGPYSNAPTGRPQLVAQYVLDGITAGGGSQRRAAISPLAIAGDRVYRFISSPRRAGGPGGGVNPQTIVWPAGWTQIGDQLLPLAAPGAGPDVTDYLCAWAFYTLTPADITARLLPQQILGFHGMCTDSYVRGATGHTTGPASRVTLARNCPLLPGARNANAGLLLAAIAGSDYPNMARKARMTPRPAVGAAGEADWLLGLASINPGQTGNGRWHGHMVAAYDHLGGAIPMKTVAPVPALGRDESITSWVLSIT